MHDLSKSVNDGVISPFHEGFIFPKLHAKFRENKTLAKTSEFTVLSNKGGCTGELNLCHCSFVP